MEGKRHALLFCKPQPATNCHHDNTSPTSTTCMVQMVWAFCLPNTRAMQSSSLERLFVPKRLELHVILHSNPPSTTTQPAMRLLPSTTRRKLALLLLLHPALATYGHTALRQTQTQSQSERPIEETTTTPAAPAGIATAAAAAVSAGGEVDKLALPLTQSLSEQDPAILGGDPASHFLMNFGHNAMANGVRKHHPKTYEEVAR